LGRVRHAAGRCTSWLDRRRARADGVPDLHQAGRRKPDPDLLRQGSSEAARLEIFYVHRHRCRIEPGSRIRTPAGGSSWSRNAPIRIVRTSSTTYETADCSTQNVTMTDAYCPRVRTR